MMKRKNYGKPCVVPVGTPAEKIPENKPFYFVIDFDGENVDFNDKPTSFMANLTKDINLLNESGGELEKIANNITNPEITETDFNNSLSAYYKATGLNNFINKYELKCIYAKVLFNTYYTIIHRILNEVEFVDDFKRLEMLKDEFDTLMHRNYSYELEELAINNESINANKDFNYFITRIVSVVDKVATKVYAFFVDLSYKLIISSTDYSNDPSEILQISNMVCDILDYECIELRNRLFDIALLNFAKQNCVYNFEAYDKVNKALDQRQRIPSVVDCIEPF